MCLRLDDNETEILRNQSGTITVYKVCYLRGVILFPPNQFSFVPYVIGDNISDRDSVELTDEESYSWNIHHGMHVHLNFASAKLMQRAYTFHNGRHVYPIIICTVKIDDLVGAGYNFKGIPEHEAVFTKFHLSQDEYDMAVGKKRKSLWRRFKEFFNLL